jgi:tRNA uridine 5-carbamoylmethylation protein Kti12
MRGIDRQLIGEEDISMAVEGRSENEIESEIKVAQVQSLQQNMMQKILQTETYNKRRLCQQFDETIDRIISACAMLVKENT